MSDVPPQQFAAYPRPHLMQPGEADRLQALADGYFGLNLIFACYIGAIGLTMALSIVAGQFARLGGFVMVIVLISLCGAKVERIGVGMGWSKGKTITARVLMALSFFCCAIIGFVTLQQIASQRMKNFGIQTGFLGVSKKRVDEAIAKLRSQEAGQGVPPTTGV